MEVNLSVLQKVVVFFLTCGPFFFSPAPTTAVSLAGAATGATVGLDSSRPELSEKPAANGGLGKTPAGKQVGVSCSHTSRR